MIPSSTWVNGVKYYIGKPLLVAGYRGALICLSLLDGQILVNPSDGKLWTFSACDLEHDQFLMAVRARRHYV